MVRRLQGAGPRPPGPRAAAREVIIMKATESRMGSRELSEVCLSDLANTQRFKVVLDVEMAIAKGTEMWAVSI